MYRHIFTERNESIYPYSSKVAAHLLKGDFISGLLYPSIANNNKAHNLADQERSRRYVHCPGADPRRTCDRSRIARRRGRCHARRVDLPASARLHRSCRVGDQATASLRTSRPGVMTAPLTLINIGRPRRRNRPRSRSRSTASPVSVPGARRFSGQRQHSVSPSPRCVISKRCAR